MLKVLRWFKSSGRGRGLIFYLDTLCNFNYNSDSDGELITSWSEVKMTYRILLFNGFKDNDVICYLLHVTSISSITS